MDPDPTDLHAQDGFALLEVIFSAVLVLIIAFGTLQLVDTTGAESAKAQDRSVAATLLSAEQLRLRSLNAGRSLANYRSTRTVTQTTGTVAQPYVISSAVDPVRDSGGPVSCTTPSTTSSPDYLRATTEVRWPGGSTPLRSVGLITPTTGSTPYDAGTLAVHVSNASGADVTNLPVTVAGRSLTTNELGCAVFSFVPQGTQTVSITQTGWVEPDLTASPGTLQATVVARQTRSVEMRFDQAGGITVGVTTPSRTTSPATPVATPVAAGFTLAHSEADFPKPSRAFTGTTRSGLFPFTSDYSVFAGQCAANDPKSYTTSSGSQTSVRVTSGQTTAASVRMPTFPYKVTRGGVALGGALVRLKPTGSGCTGTFSGTTNANGLIAIPVPYGTYTACASASASGSATPGSFTSSGESAVVTMDDPTGEPQATLTLTGTTPCS